MTKREMEWLEAHRYELLSKQPHLRYLLGELAYLSWPLPDPPLRVVHGEAADLLDLWQEGRCASCGRSRYWDRLFVDHDHVTGLIRGLLCDSCNSKEGHGAEFLEQYRQLPPADLLGIVELYRGYTYGPVRYENTWEALAERRRAVRVYVRSEEAPK